jgi:phosphoglycerate kinase
LIGGGMANTFLAAQGYQMADSLVEAEVLDQARALLAKSEGKLLLPCDMVIADAFDAEAKKQTLPLGDVPAGWRVLDIGPETVKAFGAEIAKAGTIVWNGPMGVFEFPRFAEGTYAVAKAVADSGAVSIIGGGDSVSAINQSGLSDKITHISTGGGASLEMLEGLELPGVALISDK